LKQQRSAIQRRERDATAATEAAFNRVVADIAAARSTIDPAATAAATQELFTRAAAENAARNVAITADVASDQQAVTGAGPVSGSAAAATDALTAAGAISGAAAKNLADISAQELRLMEASAGTAGRARVGEFKSRAQLLQEEAEARFLAEQAERIGREEQASRAAAARRQEQLAALAGAEDELAADIALREQEDAIKADEDWKAILLPSQIKAIEEGGAGADMSSQIAYQLYTSASKDYGGGKDAFKAKYNDLRTRLGPDFDMWLSANGLPKNVDEAWKVIDKREKASAAKAKEQKSAEDAKSTEREIKEYQRNGGSLAALAYQRKLKFEKTSGNFAFFKDKYGNTYVERITK
jgi:hypothetical protein